jgi:hypothetical protein
VTTTVAGPGSTATMAVTTPGPTVTVTTSTAPGTSTAPAVTKAKLFGRIRRIEPGPDGEGYVLGLDTAQFLEGQAAQDACAASGLGDCAPDGYFIVDPDHALQTFRVDPSARVTTVWNPCCQPTAGSLTDLVASAGSNRNPYQLRSTYYWVTVRDGVVVKLAQQYLP